MSLALIYIRMLKINSYQCPLHLKTVKTAMADSPALDSVTLILVNSDFDSGPSESSVHCHFLLFLTYHHH